MSDLFRDKAGDWDTRPVPAQISQGVFDAIEKAVALEPGMTAMDFGAGTGLLGSKLAGRVGRVLAVDVSPSMLEKLAEKPELKGKVELFCQDILEAPLPRKVDLVVSAMAMHHVKDTSALLRALQEHLVPGGRIALADLDTETGDFHAPGTEGVYHAGFDRGALGKLAADAGFVDARFVTACEVDRDQKRYPVFLLTATKPA
jgi:cyclopropane fatty-acyl-phospholipid synthase-like methyltransferase